MIWSLAHRADPRAATLADRHYSRQKPGSQQFMPAGRAFVLYAGTASGAAVWGTSWPFEKYTHHEWAGAWMCSLFRNEGCGKASTLIRQAVAATRAHFGDPPPLGMVTFVDPASVRAKADPGHVFVMAGFRLVGVTKSRGLLAFQLLPNRMPAPEPARGVQLIFGCAA